MYPFEPDANGTRLVHFEDSQPWSSLNSVPSALSDSGQFLDYPVAALESAILCNGPDGGHMPEGGVTDLLDGQHLRPELDYIYDSWMETEQVYGPPMSASSFDSVVSVSTFASGPTTNSSPEQGVDSAEDLMDYMFEGINTPWAPELLPGVYEDHSVMNGASHCQAHESMLAPIESNGSFNVDGSVINPGINTVLPEVSRSARRWPRLVRLVCACHRLRSKTDMFKGVSKKKMDRKRKRGVEIRISKTMIRKDGKYLKDKAWLGTYATRAQVGRALDVGKYFLCAKKKKTFSDPNSEKILSALKDHFHAQPLTELVGNVTKLAKYYGENGSLPQSLHIL